MTALPDIHAHRYPPPGSENAAQLGTARRADDARTERERFLDETISFWEPRAGRPLTRENAREIVENVTRFFLLLAELDRRQRESERSRRAPLTAAGP